MDAIKKPFPNKSISAPSKSVSDKPVSNKPVSAPHKLVSNKPVLSVSSEVSGSKRYTTREFLGEGGYGKVYKCKDEEGQQVAIKFIPMGKEGITCLLETSIMMTYHHEFLNRATIIESDWSETRILQEIACVDLKVKVKNQPTDESTAIHWIHSICQGIRFLHLEGIIHCDIKTDNILLFEDGTIKLADFTLSVLKSHHDDIYTHSVCTLPYRAPEVFTKTGWSNPVDLWGLGCVIYEILVGDLLVPLQLKTIKKDDKTTKNRLKKMTLRALWQWRKNYEEIEDLKDHIENLVDITLSPRFQHFDPRIQDLILTTTSYDPSRRPTIHQVIQNSIFEKFTTSSWSISCKQASDPPEIIKKIIQNRVNQIHKLSPCDYEVIARRTMILYSMIKIVNLERIQIIDTCIWIAYKLVAGRIPKILATPPLTLGFTPHHVIYKAELVICKHLDYKLHRCSDNDLYIKIG